MFCSDNMSIRIADIITEIFNILSRVNIVIGFDVIRTVISMICVINVVGVV